MKHDIECYLVPSEKITATVTVGTETISVDKYIADGVATFFYAGERQTENTEYQAVIKDTLMNIEMLYLNADRDIDFKKDDIVYTPFGKYKIIKVNYQRTRPSKNGFYIQNITVDLDLIKQQ